MMEVNGTQYVAVDKVRSTPCWEMSVIEQYPSEVCVQCRQFALKVESIA